MFSFSLLYTSIDNMAMRLAWRRVGIFDPLRWPCNGTRFGTFSGDFDA